MEAQRFILFAALAFVLLLIWQAWIDFTQPQQTAITNQVQTDPNSTVATDGALLSDNGTIPSAPANNNLQGPVDGGGSVPAMDNGQAQPMTDAATSALASNTRITVETDLLKVEIDTLGGDIRSAELLKYPEQLDEPDTPFTLMNDVGADLFLAQSGLIGKNADLPNHKTVFESDQTTYRLNSGERQLKVNLKWQADDGVVYTKVYTFHRDRYVIDVNFEINNGTAQNWDGYFYGQFLRTNVADESDNGFFGRLPSYKGPAIYTPEEKYEKIDFGELEEKNLAVTTPSGWVAMLQHYFVSAWLPQDAESYQFYSRVSRTASGPRYNVGYKTLNPVIIAPGQSGQIGTRLFVGPKEQSRLQALGDNLELTVDFGWLTPVSQPLFVVLSWIHGVIGNWGWSIILLTVLIKALFYPLSAASYKSMAKMKKLQPRLKTLKERYGDDRSKMNQAMMEMYKKEKVNPMGGCLPMLIQIPVFIALYWVLLESVELRQAPWAFWINDLSTLDPYYILPVLMGVSMLAQQWLNPQPLDTMQKNIMMAMPFVFTIFFLWFPAGLVLYWLVNNVLSIAQQWLITRQIENAKT